MVSLVHYPSISEVYPEISNLRGRFGGLYKKAFFNAPIEDALKKRSRFFRASHRGLSARGLNIGGLSCRLKFKRQCRGCDPYIYAIFLSKKLMFSFFNNIDEQVYKMICFSQVSYQHMSAIIALFKHEFLCRKTRLRDHDVLLFCPECLHDEAVVVLEESAELFDVLFDNKIELDLFPDLINIATTLKHQKLLWCLSRNGPSDTFSDLAAAEALLSWAPSVDIIRKVDFTQLRLYSISDPDDRIFDIVSARPELIQWLQEPSGSLRYGIITGLSTHLSSVALLVHSATLHHASIMERKIFFLWCLNYRRKVIAYIAHFKLELVQVLKKKCPMAKTEESACECGCPICSFYPAGT